MSEKPEPKDEDKARDKEAARPKPEPEPDKNPKYIFKILPADPKNAFDFEDVADK